MHEGQDFQNHTSDSVNDSVKWFAMRIIGSRADIRIRQELKEIGIEFFQPLHQVVKQVGGRAVKKEVPIVGGLFFCHGTEKEIMDYSHQTGNRLQFIIPRGKKISDRIVVDDHEMEQFIKAVNNFDDHVFLSIEEAQQAAGKTVRIHGGVLDGAVGKLEMKRAKKKTFILILENMMAVSIKFSPEVIEVLE